LIGLELRQHPRGKHLRNLLKRFAYNYLVRDFSVGTIQAVAGLALTVFGITFGAVSWIRNAEADRDTPVGTVILATLPIILGFQLLLAALSFDIANVPTRPIQKILRPRPWARLPPVESAGGDRASAAGSLTKDEE